VKELSEMTGKECAKISDSFCWDRRSAIPENRARHPYLERPLNVSTKCRPGLVTSVRSGLRAIAFLIALTFVSMFTALCVIIILVDEQCGPAFDYYGCEIPALTGGFHAPQFAAPQSASLGPLGTQ
jgi:hypothetical protein